MLFEVFWILKWKTIQINEEIDILEDNGDYNIHKNLNKEYERETVKV